MSFREKHDHNAWIDLRDPSNNNGWLTFSYTRRAPTVEEWLRGEAQSP